MTNKKDYAPITYNCNGATVDFPFAWKILNDNYIIVTLINSSGVGTVLTIGTHYTVDFDAVGGNVKTKTAYTSGNKILIERKAPLYQDKTFSTSSGFQASEVEKAFDNVSINLQDMDYNIETFKANLTTSVETKIATNKADTDSQIATNKANTDAQIATNKTSTDNQIATNKANTDAQIATNKSQTDAEITRFETEVNSKIAQVNEAVKKLNKLDEAVQKCEQSAETAEEQATITQQLEAEVSALKQSTQAIATQVTTEHTEAVAEMQSILATAESTVSNRATRALDNLDATGQAVLNAKANVVDMNKKANLICYGNRDFDYKQPDFIKADKSTVTIKGGTAIKVSTGEYFHVEADAVYNIANILDTGTVAGGKDYYFYLDAEKNLKATLSETIPSGCVLIGGAHTLCVGVTSSNAPALEGDSFWSSHPAIGYNAGHFIPNSSWTPAFKSGAKTGNKGMVLIDHAGMEKFWVDIYLQSGTGTATKSSYAGTITNSRQPIQHQWDMNLVGKKLPTDNQFMVFAEGSNNKTNISGNAIPSGKLTGGYNDTAGKRMISGFFVECCCGYLWQWGDEIAPVGGSGWADYAVTNRGGSYGMPYVLRFGGDCGNSSHCGSWARACSYTRTVVFAVGGARGVSLHIEKHHS